MNTKAHRSAIQIKKFLTSAMVLLIFLMPVFATSNWVSGIVKMHVDPREVFSQKQITTWASDDCDDNISDLRPFDEPLVTVTFDDGWESIYSNGFELLEKHCIDTTQYILGSHFSEQQYLSVAQVRSMQQHGHEVGSHTMTHPNLADLSIESMRWELEESQKLLEEEFGPINHLASPLGSYNDEVIRETRSLYGSHRNTAADPKIVGDEDINTRDNFNEYEIIAYTVRHTTTPQDIRNLINYTKKRKGWLVLNYHQVDDSDQIYAVSKDTLAEHLQIITDSRIRTPVIGDVLEAIQTGNRDRM